MKTTAASLVSIPFFFAHLSAAISAIDCRQNIMVDKVKFDFSKLDSVHSVYVVNESQPPAVYNTTWSVNICGPLPNDKNLDKKEQCPSGTNVCGVRRSYNPVEDDRNTSRIENVIPIAGSFTHDTGHTMEPKWTRLKTMDTEEEGLQLELNGPKYGKLDQKAVIHFQCDPDRTGNDAVVYDKQRRQDSDDEVVGLGDLRFKSYGPLETKSGTVEVLRLDWRTMYACENYKGAPPSASSSWGFFTWFILIAFLGIAAYLIFGSWLNYNRYGARGWDLLPHGDTIRDIPYLMKDWGMKVADTVAGGPSRGGYSAV